MKMKRTTILKTALVSAAGLMSRIHHQSLSPPSLAVVDDGAITCDDWKKQLEAAFDTSVSLFFLAFVQRRSLVRSLQSMEFFDAATRVARAQIAAKALKDDTLAPWHLNSPGMCHRMMSFAHLFRGRFASAMIFAEVFFHIVLLQVESLSLPPPLF